MDTNHFKKRLEDELQLIEKELSETQKPDIDQSATEADEIADRFEDQQEAKSEHTALEARKIEVEAALARIEMGTYGTCRVCEGTIEEERLEANPAAATCAKCAAA